MIKVRAVSPLRRDALRIVFPLATFLSTTITWAGDEIIPQTMRSLQCRLNVKPTSSAKSLAKDARARQHSIRAR